jgi:hypothetical protein
LLRTKPAFSINVTSSCFKFVPICTFQVSSKLVYLQHIYDWYPLHNDSYHQHKTNIYEASPMCIGKHTKNLNKLKWELRWESSWILFMFSSKFLWFFVKQIIKCMRKEGIIIHAISTCNFKDMHTSMKKNNVSNGISIKDTYWRCTCDFPTSTLTHVWE